MNTTKKENDCEDYETSNETSVGDDDHSFVWELEVYGSLLLLE